MGERVHRQYGADRGAPPPLLATFVPLSPVRRPASSHGRPLPTTGPPGPNYETPSTTPRSSGAFSRWRNCADLALDIVGISLLKFGVIISSPMLARTYVGMMTMMTRPCHHSFLASPLTARLGGMMTMMTRFKNFFGLQISENEIGEICHHSSFQKYNSLA